MSSLAELQQLFQNAVLHNDSGFLSCIDDTPEVSREQRVAIYGEAYRLRLIEALDSNYLGLAYLLGDDQFNRLGNAYIDAHPSRYKSIRWFGDELADFLDTTSPYNDQPMLAEMAQADWAMTLAFDSADAGTIGPERMAEIEPGRWGELVFSFHPGIQRLDLNYTVIPFRQAVESGEQDIDAPERSDQPVPWLIWRQALRVPYRSMDVDEAWAFDSARSGACFAQLCEGLTEWVDPHNVAERAVGFLKRWLIDELVTDAGI